MANKQLELSSSVDLYRELIKTLLIFPIWLIFIFPVAVISYVTTFLARKLHHKKPKSSPRELVADILKSTKSIDISSDSRNFDMILFGATGFTGKLAAEYITRQYGLKSFKWAISGRRLDALEKLRSELVMIDPHMDKLMIIVADASDNESIARMVASTKVVITTAGPFAKYGSTLVRYCAAYGTHYCDITGETDWVREMIVKYDDVARATGAKMIPHCGHDCIPYDLTVMTCAKQLSKHGDKIAEINLCDEVYSAPSGGTLATAVHSLSDRAPAPSSLGFDPLIKDETGKKSSNKVIVKNVAELSYSNDHKAWLGPFIMAAVNANCVRRSNVLSNYNDKLIYREGIVFPSYTAGFIYILNLIYFASILFSGPLRGVFNALGMIPNPGEGPSNETMDKGFLRVHGYATGIKGGKCKTTFYFATDPGYRDTARMLVEAGLVMILDHDKLENKDKGGFTTPASCLGDALLDRLLMTGSSIQVDIKA